MAPETSATRPAINRSSWVTIRAVDTGPVGLVLPAGGAPLSAEQVEERTRTTPDGNSVSEAIVSRIRRDRAGRLRVEWRVESDQHESARVAYLLDPVASCSYMLVIEARIATQMSGPESGDLRVGFPAMGRSLPDGKWRTRTESLGTRVIRDIEVEGSRTIRTSEDEPTLTALKEMWLSEILHLTLLVEASGPGWRHTARLQNIDLREPDPNLFVIPGDYAVR